MLQERYSAVLGAVVIAKGGIFEAGFGEKVAFSWPSVDRFGKFFGGLLTLGQVKSVPNFCQFGPQRAEKRNLRTLSATKPRTSVRKLANHPVDDDDVVAPDRISSL